MVKTNIKPDLSVTIGKLKLKNPIITASGTFGYADEYENYVDLQNIGAIITKGITLKPREGNPQPRIKEVKNGLINCIGLENVGINTFVEKKLPILLNKNIPYIVNIAGFSFGEYVELAHICEVNNISAIEINVSCPNVKEGCLEFGKDKETLYKLISAIREKFSNTLIVKLSSNVSYPAEMALAVQNAGADAISAINTIKSMALNTKIENGKLKYNYIKGGLSGPAIKNIALNFIHEIKEVVSIPIIGMGGITTVEDIIDFFAVGATAIQIGTANFTYPDISGKLVYELEQLLISNNISSLSELLRSE